MNYKALKVFQDEEDQISPKICELKTPQLAESELLIKSEYSCVNYKDALAVTGKGKILRKLPLVAGIDVSGEIIESKSDHFKKGDKVLVNGCGLGETMDGGFSEIVKIHDEAVVSLPEGLTTKEAMTIGTAGFTAALCLHRMEVNGQNPEKGPILVTGASGGVGSLAIQILSRNSYKVIAVSGKKTAVEQLKSFGASEVMSPEELQLGERPLEKARWAGAIDNAGGELLSGIARHIDLWGNIACVGLADSPKLNTTVMPLILRGVSFLGASSANCPISLRRQIWNQLGKEWKPQHLNRIIHSEINLSEITEYSKQLLQRKITGRALVKL